MEQKESKIFVSGSLLSCLVDNDKEFELPNFTPITKLTNPDRLKKIVAWFAHRCLIWKGKNELEFIEESNKSEIARNKFTIEKEEIKDIQSGKRSYLILTQSGKVFSLADYEHCVDYEIPISDDENSTWEEIRPVPFFNEKENNRKVKSIEMIAKSNYYLCEDGKLFANGWLIGGNYQKLPILISENVSKIFGGFGAYHCFFAVKGELFVCGSNDDGQFGIGNNEIQEGQLYVKVPDWKEDDIFDLRSFDSHSVLITKEGKVFSCGDGDVNGIGEDQSVFTEIPLLQNKKIVNIAGCKKMSLALTTENELYGWNLQQEEGEWNLPREIHLPQIYQNNTSPFEISCVELRTGLKIDKIQKIITENGFNEKEFNMFLKWVYFEKQLTGLNLKAVEPIFKSLNLPFPLRNKTFKGDLLKLYKDEESKDFHILVQKRKNKSNIKNNRNDNLDKENGDGNESGNTEKYDQFEKIPVHKLILLVRSGLFRDMFDNISEKEKSINQIKDYTYKSKDSLHALIQYFYTGEIKLEVDADPELIYEELVDSVEYYQLSANCNLKTQLVSIKKK
ncbi:btk-binding protein-related [Anaeramoeba flamelloides]|uniref:Btk-binding protein-related n=1 Tax=Anaeramoeba flamelloides TaxID=1746091 RepID=A0ABQ8YZM5_9EUKA|nr:btk-binding protein-related [Anaeramoeba flamelloides]